jgi:chitin synthase
MGLDANGTPAITDPWPVKNVSNTFYIKDRKHRKVANNSQIVYVSIMGTVMLAAFLEWFLWLAAFLYCLVKVFQKAEHLSIRIMSILMMVAFTLLRSVLLPLPWTLSNIPSEQFSYLS